MLTVKNLTIAPLLHEVNFRVPAGEIVTLMGPSGSGKSTLFAWMVGALSADFKAHGELWLNDRRCDMVPVETRGIGILFQDALLFDAFSVGQNLMLALPAHIVGRARRNAVEQALETAGLANHYTSDPAASAPGSACCAPFSPSRRHCCSTSRSVDWIKRCAPHSGRGYSRSLASAGSRWCWSRMMRTIFRPAAR